MHVGKPKLKSSARVVITIADQHLCENDMGKESFKLDAHGTNLKSIKTTYSKLEFIKVAICKILGYKFRQTFIFLKMAMKTS